MKGIDSLSLVLASRGGVGALFISYLDLWTSTDIPLALQSSPARVLLGSGLLWPCAAPFEDLGTLNILGCTGLCGAACPQAQAVVLSFGTDWAGRGDLENTGGIQGYTPGNTAMPSLPGLYQSPVSGGGQGFSCLVLVGNAGTAPPLRDLPRPINTSHLPSVFHPTCWLTLLLRVGKPRSL